MQWLEIDSRTFSMIVPGGMLYRYSDERGHALHFVPFVNSVPSHFTPYYGGHGVGIGGAGTVH